MNVMKKRVYDGYHTYQKSLSKTALQDILDYESQDKTLYADYLEDSKLEDTVDAVTCSMQQQDMNAMYHVKYEEEGM